MYGGQGTAPSNLAASISDYQSEFTGRCGKACNQPSVNMENAS